MIGELDERRLRKIYLASLKRQLRSLGHTEVPEWLLDHSFRVPSDSDLILIRNLIRGTPSKTRSSRSRSRYV